MMTDEKERIERVIRREVGAQADHPITYSFQYEFEKSLSIARGENDPASTRNNLFALITELAAFIAQNVEDEEAQKSAERELAMLESDDLSPKTTIKYEERDKRYQLTYDSYTVHCFPTELAVSMEQLNREREEVTIRKLWAMLGRLMVLAYKHKALKSSFIVERSAIHE